MPVKPIQGMMRKHLVLDLSVAFGLGTSFGYLYWYGWHIPSIRRRDNYYAKLEEQRTQARSG